MSLSPGSRRASSCNWQSAKECFAGHPSSLSRALQLNCGVRRLDERKRARFGPCTMNQDALPNGQTVSSPESAAPRHRLHPPRPWSRVVTLPLLGSALAGHGRRSTEQTGIRRRLVRFGIGSARSAVALHAPSPHLRDLALDGEPGRESVREGYVSSSRLEPRRSRSSPRLRSMEALRHLRAPTLSPGARAGHHQLAFESVLLKTRSECCGCAT